MRNWSDVPPVFLIVAASILPVVLISTLLALVPPIIMVPETTGRVIVLFPLYVACAGA